MALSKFRPCLGQGQGAYLLAWSAACAVCDPPKGIKMKSLLHIFIVAPLALAGVAPASADPGAQAQPVEATAPAADRSATVEKAKAQLSDWRIKLDAYAEKVRVESQPARTEAAEDLNKAWAKTKDAAARLETASAAEWANAKAEFNKQSDAMAASWAKTGH